MARLSNVALPAQNSTGALDRSSAELGHLLSRLQQSILDSDPARERRLRTSEYERARIATNLDYARTALTKLEQDALSLRAPVKRAEVQGDLNQKRETFELLVDRLHDLQQVAIEDDDSSEGEDILGDLDVRPTKSVGAVPVTATSQQQVKESTTKPQPSTTTTTHPLATTTNASSLSQHSAAPTQTTQTLRARTSDAPSSSPSAHATARAALFSNRRKPATPETSTATAEAILDQQREEQESLTGSILNIAKALKDSSNKFSATLESDKEVVGRAGEGMDKTERNMDAARGRMGALRKMTEGKGWIGRMILYAQIYALMLVVVLLVFVMPKLRF